MNLSTLKLHKEHWLVEKYPTLFKGTIYRDTTKRVKGFISEGDLILDIGSLNAPFTRYLPNNTVAIDLGKTGNFGFSQNILNTLNSLDSIYPVLANAEYLPFKNNKFDKIVCTEVIEHIINDKLAVKEMARVLKPSGEVLATTPNLEVVPLAKGIKEHVRHYTGGDLQVLFKKYFNDVIVIKRFHFFNILTIQDRLGLRYAMNPNLFLGLLALLSGWVYDFIHWLELFLKVNGRYNLVMIAKNPKKALKDKH